MSPERVKQPIKSRSRLNNVCLLYLRALLRTRLIFILWHLSSSLRCLLLLACLKYSYDLFSASAIYSDRTRVKFINETTRTTRMVQLPATAAIEYVAACCTTRKRTKTRTKTRTITKIVRGAYARSPQVQCVNAPSRLSVQHRSVTDKQKKTGQTQHPSSAVSRPPLPKFSGYVEVDAHYIFHPSTIWVRPLFTELGPKTPLLPKKQTNICRLSGDIINHKTDLV